MRDLKHLTYFEDLLQEANNALVVQAQAEGKKCVAFVCENTPEPLMNLDNTFGVRLHAPNTGSMDIATYYMTIPLVHAYQKLRASRLSERSEKRRATRARLAGRNAASGSSAAGASGGDEPPATP